MVTFKKTTLAGKGPVTLSRWENDAGDIWYVIRIQGHSDAKREHTSTIEFTSAELAQETFLKLVR